LFDIGNTRIGMASWYEGRMHPARQLALEHLQEEPAWLSQAWKDLPEGSERFVVVSSVSPPRFEMLANLIAAQCDESEAVLIGRDIAVPIEANVPAPEKVGTDRLCSAAAAHQVAKAACVVASFGTALTVDLVSDDAVFMGGAILPGMAVAAKALHEHTALLPDVAVSAPEETWGTSTAEAINVGVFCGLVGALREITERYATQIGKWPTLILTGGDAAAIADAANFVDRVIPDLCLRGVALAFEKALHDAEST
jgi:type III pantothenate kinase